MDWHRDPLEPNRSLSEEPAEPSTADSLNNTLGLSNGLSNDPHWVPIVDYAVRHSMSTSTIRRYIKAGKIKFKLVEGRYLIYSDAAEAPVSTGSETEILQKELLKAREQIDELKMLVALYEEKLFSKNN